MQGQVVIVGAGPGEVEHLTLGALREIHAADTILYDALVGDSILAEFPAHATTVFVGKRSGKHAYTQTMIISLMIRHALEGRRVLRLKGGDPSIFAHLASELGALRALQIPVKVLPGVSALLAAAAQLETPLTARGASRQIWICDGHTFDFEKQAKAWAEFQGTRVFYMSAGRTAEISAALLSEKLDAQTPCALVENAGSAEALTHRGSLFEFASGELTRKTLGPGIFLVGDVLRLQANALDAELVSSKQKQYATAS